jgi:tocopherol O-methyltransferase
VILPRTAQTTAAVAAHYDELDLFYREVWGEHVHHGYWATGRETPEAAAEALVDLLAARLGFAPGQTVCDIGCGYGASARRLAERFGVTVAGVTVSAAQAEVAAARAADGVRVAVVDWLANDFPDACFDRAYAIESSEHMADKQRFFDEAFRTLRPGGRLGVFAWLARDCPRPWQVRHLLEPICREGRLPGMGDEADYRRMAGLAGFETALVEDLSDRVARTWSICARRLMARLATRPRYLRFLLDGSARNRIFAVTMLRLIVAYRTGSMRYRLMIFQRGGAPAPAGQRGLLTRPEVGSTISA